MAVNSSIATEDHGDIGSSDDIAGRESTRAGGRRKVAKLT